MKREKKIDFRSESGFTLMELIVVIGVIAILIAILLPQFNGYTDKANAVSAKSNAKIALTSYSNYKTGQDVANKEFKGVDAGTAVSKGFGEKDVATLKTSKKITFTAGTKSTDDATIATQKGDLTFTTTLEVAKGNVGKTVCSGDKDRCDALVESGSVDETKTN
ncbi:MAG: prepilin-type N-terminal cleavage/methylation domain-containing protein [Bacilli bacterium]